MNGWLAGWIDGYIHVQPSALFHQKNFVYRISREGVCMLPLLTIRHCSDFTVLLCCNKQFLNLPTPQKRLIQVIKK